MALSGIFLATELVQTIANNGRFDHKNMRTAVESIFTLHTESVSDVYGGKSNLETGQQRLADQLGGKTGTPNLQITHYALNLLKLENKLQANNEVMERIRRGIESTATLRNHYDTLDDEIISPLAKLYTENISDVKPRIVVHGAREYLENPTHANTIRACLLAGIRSAVLWRQCGGTRWKIVSGRQKYVNQANKDLESAANDF